MKITKLGHCCLLLEVNEKRILTDPGKFTTEQNTLTNIDLVLITHEHLDHFHTESVQAIIDHNPTVTIVCNSNVGALLDEQGISYVLLEGRAEETIKDITLKAYDGKHVEIVGDYGLVQNTGYSVSDGDFFFPGDAYTIPDEKIHTLALPVAGPWCKISDAIEYALAVKPRRSFPVHDAVLSEVGKSVTYPHFERELAKANIQFFIASGQDESSQPV